MIVQKSDTNEIEIIWLGVGNCGCGVPQKSCVFPYCGRDSGVADLGNCACGRSERACIYPSCIRSIVASKCPCGREFIQCIAPDCGVKR